MTRAITALPALALLAACATPPASPTAGPGPRAASASEAAGIFSAVCVGNRGDLSNAPTTLAGLPFTLNSQNDLYFHNDLDLSIGLEPSGGLTRCAMAWGSLDSNGANRQAITSVAPDAEVIFPGDTPLFFTFIFGTP